MAMTAAHFVSEYCRMKEITVKPVFSDHSKIDKTKILMTNGSLMKVSIGAVCNTFDLH